MSDTLQDILKRQGKCCITGKPLVDSKHVNLVNLDVKAQWNYPVWGNILTGVEGMALAVVHDDAINKGQPISPVKYAIEITGKLNKEIHYHEVETLKGL